MRRTQLGVVMALLFVGVLGWFFYQQKIKTMVVVSQQQSKPSEPLSYAVMLVAQDQVRAVKPAPTEAALYYAYVASVYNDVLAKSGQGAAVDASQKMMDTFYPDRTQAVDEALRALKQKYQLGADTAQDASANGIVDSYLGRYKTDGHDLKWDGVIPVGADKWRKERPADPFSPRAGEWKRWVVNKSISVPPPPAPGSAEMARQLDIVKQAAAARNGQDINTINFWGGTPGTESPAGIWQNQLYRTVNAELTGDSIAMDKQYASIQKELAQTLSDAFMECWKVKYTYWTARPNMIDPTIKTAMDNPNFPGYVSGHSTISKAAADVLSVLVPKHAADWEAMAVAARDSRLKAGIHFDVDNQVGFQVGTEVAKQMVANLKLTQQL